MVVRRSNEVHNNDGQKKLGCAGESRAGSLSPSAGGVDGDTKCGICEICDAVSAKPPAGRGGPLTTTNTIGQAGAVSCAYFPAESPVGHGGP